MCPQVTHRRRTKDETLAMGYMEDTSSTVPPPYSDKQSIKTGGLIGQQREQHEVAVDKKVWQSVLSWWFCGVVRV